MNDDFNVENKLDENGRAIGFAYGTGLFLDWSVIDPNTVLSAVRLRLQFVQGAMGEDNSEKLAAVDAAIAIA